MITRIEQRRLRRGCNISIELVNLKVRIVWVRKIADRPEINIFLQMTNWSTFIQALRTALSSPLLRALESIHVLQLSVGRRALFSAGGSLRLMDSLL
jgi:hypothetical protein